jgi:prepilin signal peptidase PulO-like enzyme (type II secretory pathway)
MAGLLITWVVLIAQEPFWRSEQEEDHSQPDGAEASAFTETPLTNHATNEFTVGGQPLVREVPPLLSKARAFGWVAALLLVAMFVVLVIDGGGLAATPLSQPFRALMPAFFFFALIVSESTVARESDQEIVQAIDEERHTARKMVATELGMLLPAAGLGVIGILVVTAGGDLSRGLSQGLHTTLVFDRIELLRHWQPLYGFATAASGFIIAGALGWAVRIIFTFVFGREAFGTGDIHLMAAAGCVAGWQAVLLGFFLTCGISLLGWAATLPFKRSRALPLGPWLSLAFLLVVVFYDVIIAWPPIRNVAHVVNWIFLENSQPARMIITP